MLTWQARPILTYGNQGVLKPGVHADDHAVVFSERPPQCLEREAGLMSKTPIKINVISPSQKLDMLSRLNYAKIYTVEHNVKVFFIGRVDSASEREVIKAYNHTHPPLTYPSRSINPAYPEADTRHAYGGESSYPSSTPYLGTEQYSSSPYSAPNTYIPPVSQPYSSAIIFTATPQMPPSERHDSSAQGDFQEPSYHDGYDAEER